MDRRRLRILVAFLAPIVTPVPACPCMTVRFPARSAHPAAMHQVTSRDQESRAKENPETAQVIAVDSVTFEGNLQFPISIRARLATELEERDFDARADWTAQATQLLGGAWREMGYLKAAPAISYKVVSNDSIREHVTLTVRVAEGPQYSLGYLRLRLSDPEKNPLIASEELEQRVSLRERDILNTRKIEDSTSGRSTELARSPLSGWIWRRRTF